MTFAQEHLRTQAGADAGTKAATHAKIDDVEVQVVILQGPSKNLPSKKIGMAEASLIIWGNLFTQSRQFDLM
jgi:hypothetical protein